jgi:hypothetical protein
VSWTQPTVLGGYANRKLDGRKPTMRSNPGALYEWPIRPTPAIGWFRVCLRPTRLAISLFRGCPPPHVLNPVQDYVELCTRVKARDLEKRMATVLDPRGCQTRTPTVAHPTAVRDLSPVRLDLRTTRGTLKTGRYYERLLLKRRRRTIDRGEREVGSSRSATAIAHDVYREPRTVAASNGGSRVEEKPGGGGGAEREPQLRRHQPALAQNSGHFDPNDFFGGCDSQHVTVSFSTAHYSICRGAVPSE